MLYSRTAAIVLGVALALGALPATAKTTAFCPRPVGSCPKGYCCDCVFTSKAGCCTHWRILNKGLCQ